MNIKLIKFPISRIIFSLLSFLCMIMIFCFSCENGVESAGTSGGITEFITENFIQGYENMTAAQKIDTFSIVEHIIRKTAHFSIYLALGFCISCAAGRRKLLSKGSGAALLTCFLYACSDELHQYLVPDRSCRFTDVLIDTCGALTGIILSLFIMSLSNHIFKIKRPD